MRTRRSVAHLLFAVTVVIFLQCSTFAEVKNAGFEETAAKAKDDPEIQALEKLNWTFGEPILWPTEWGPNPFYASTGIILKISQENPHAGKNCLFLGQNPNASGWALAQTIPVEKGYYRVSFWARGEGKVGAVIDNSFQIIPVTQAAADWRECVGALPNRAGNMKQICLILGGIAPGAYFDDVSCEKCNVLDAEVIDESNRMKADGKWLSDEAPAKQDQFQSSLTFLSNVVSQLEKFLEADPRPERLELIDLLKKRVAELKGVDSPSGAVMNEAQALTNIVKRLHKEMSFKDVSE